VFTFDEIIARANNTSFVNMLLLTVDANSPAAAAWDGLLPMLDGDPTEQITSIEEMISEDSIAPIEPEAILEAELGPPIISREDVLADNPMAGVELAVAEEDRTALYSSLDSSAAVVTHSDHGGTDTSTFKYSEIQGEFRDKLHTSKIGNLETEGEIYKITARRFDTVHADGSQSEVYDKVKTWETPRDNHLEADDNRARMFAQKAELEMLYDILAFEFVKVRASSGGNDKANVTKPLDFDLLFENGWDV
jgi:hypothetical protein